MLSYHCPECNVPLFKEEDTIFCPSCQKEAVIEQEGEKRAKGNESTSIITSESEIRREGESLNQGQGTERKIITGSSGRTNEGTDLTQMEDSLKESLFKLSKELENAKDVEEIKEIVEVMDKITNLAERIKNL